MSPTMRRILTMASLVVAGEAIYTLPYLRQTFQTTMLDVMEVTNTELGWLNSMFGLLALLCYFPGGWLADKFSARKLLTVSLLATGLGGLYMATVPPYGALLAVHAFWGVSSILTFWAALIKATRSWGGPDGQGRAFGILDGGRGLVAAVLASAVLGIFTLYADPGDGFVTVVTVYAVMALVAAVVTWLVVPEDDPADEAPAAEQAAAEAGGSRVLAVLRMPVVWLQALVICAAYMAYWGTFDFAAFAVDGHGQDEVFGATVGTLRLWMRPVAAVGAGLIADKLSPSKTIAGAFTILVGFYALLATVPPEAGLWMLWVDVAAVSIAVFALRGVYYALLEEGNVPAGLTGTAVGFVSVLGYTPDVFTPLISGYLLDTYPGATGHQLFFAVMAVVSFVGLGATMAIRLLTPSEAAEPVPAPARVEDGLASGMGSAVGAI